MNTNEVRWKQRFENFKNARKQFLSGLELSKSRELSSLEKQGLIQAFEFTQEMSWKVLQDYLKHQGIKEVVGSRDAFRLAFQNQLISNGDLWLDTILTRNQTSHLYDESILDEVFEKVVNQYPILFEQLEARMNQLI
jgi:nucleotidyltransferase substrate binding protein (TIGR01987 family)